MDNPIDVDDTLGVRPALDDDWRRTIHNMVEAHIGALERHKNLVRAGLAAAVAAAVFLGLYLYDVARSVHVAEIQAAVHAAKQVAEDDQRRLTALEARIAKAPLLSPADAGVAPTAAAKRSDDQLAEASPPSKDFIEILSKGYLSLLSIFFLGVIGFLGLKRLQLYDNDLNNIRKSIDERFAQERKFLFDTGESMKKSIDSRLAEFEKYFGSMGENQVNDAVKKHASLIEEREGEFSIKFNNIIRAVEDRLQPYKWLAEHKDDSEHFTGVTTVETAHQRVSELLAEQKVDIALAVARRAIGVDDSGESIGPALSGAGNDFHNLATALGSEGHAELALRVAQAGSKVYPKNVDLLADVVFYAEACGREDLASQSKALLDKIDRTLWNWRAFVFVGDYLEHQGEIVEARTLYQDFKTRCPYDERAYSQEADILIRHGNLDDGIKILEDGMKKVRRCAQTALKAAGVYLDMGRYDDAIRAADRMLESTAEDQPSANPAAGLWVRACALEGLFSQALEEARRNSVAGVFQGDTLLLKDLARAAIIDFEAAIAHPGAISQYRRRGPERLALIKKTLKQLNIQLEDGDGDGDGDGDEGGVEVMIPEGLKSINPADPEQTARTFLEALDGFATNPMSAVIMPQIAQALSRHISGNYKDRLIATLEGGMTALTSEAAKKLAASLISALKA